MIHGSPPSRVVVTRPIGRGEELSRELERRGIRVLSLPLLVYTVPTDLTPLRRAISSDDYDVWAFTSSQAVRSALQLRQTQLPDPPPRVVAVGSATAQALASRGVFQVETPEVPRAEGIVDLLAATLQEPSRILFPRAADARSTLADGLRAAGHRVDDLVAYDKALPTEAPDRFRSHLQEGPLGWVIFTSPRIVRHFVELVGNSWPSRRDSLIGVSIGPITSAALRRAGVSTILEAEAPTDQSLVQCLVAS